MSRRSEVRITNRFYSDACKHLDNLNEADKAVNSEQRNCQQICQKALEAFQFFNFELVNAIGIAEAISLVKKLPSKKPRSNILRYYLLGDNFNDIFINSSKVTSQETEFAGNIDGFSDLNNEIEIKFKLSQGLESLDLTLDVSNKKSHVRPWVPLLVQSKCTLTEKTRKLSWLENKNFKQFISIPDLEVNEKRPVILKNCLDVASIGLPEKIQVLISEIKVLISIPAYNPVFPIYNKQVSRRFFNTSPKIAA